MNVILAYVLALWTSSTPPPSTGETVNARVHQMVAEMDCRRHQAETQEPCTGEDPTRALGERVKRLEKGGFEVKLARGRPVRLAAPDTSYFLVGEVPELGSLLFYVIHAEEETAYLLVRLADGQRTLLGGEPNFSPDLQRFAIAFQDYGGGSGAAEIWRVSPKGPKREWRHMFKTEGPTNLQWLDAETLQLELTPEMGSPHPVKVQRAQGAWKLDKR